MVYPTTTTIVEIEPTTTIADNAKINSEISDVNEVTMTESPTIDSVSIEISPINVNTANSSVPLLVEEIFFLTPSSQSRTSSYAIKEDVASSILGYNHFAAFEYGDLSIFESSYDIAQKTRGEKYIKPTQKIQQMQ